jgi:hypothetical protein
MLITESAHVIAHSLAAALFDLVPVAHADGSTTTTPPSYGTPGFLFFLIAYFTRKRPIGGWLMLYYWGLYGGGAVTFFLILSTIGNLAPSAWAAIPTWRYILAVIASLLPVTFIFAEVVAGSMLLSKRNEATLKLLRLILIGYLVADAIAIGLNFEIYIKPWEESVLNIYSAIVGSIWLAYFYLSTRVKAVFVTHTWVEASAGGRDVKVMAPAERKYRTRRASLIGAVFFVGFYAYYSFNEAAKNADQVGRLVATALIALLLGLFCYFLPILRKKRDALNGRVFTADTMQLEQAPSRPTLPPID